MKGKPALPVLILAAIFILSALATASADNLKEITGTDSAPMVLIPAGEFMMGSPAGEGRGDEHPQHKVVLDAYYIDKYEVTVARYRKFCKATNRRMPPAPSWGWINNHPIVNVTWNDANAYAQWAGKRLPTEAEWEKAARAGTTTAFYCGDSLSSDSANFDGDFPYGGAKKGAYREQTTPVGSFKPNAFGLYDMAGNAWEWCSDWFHEDYYQESPKNNPPGPNDGNYGVLRGGCWFQPGVFCRSAERNVGYNPRFRNSDSYGFRCVVSP